MLSCFAQDDKVFGLRCISRRDVICITACGAVQPADLIPMKTEKGENRTRWSLPRLMEGLHARVALDLRVAREAIGHAPARGEASQNVWINLFESYLPERYASRSATIVDSRGEFSDQIDVVIYDRQYSPLLFNFDGQTVVPAEAVYAVFESKQELQGHFVRYAQEKAATVRRLYRTSVDVPTINGRFRKKPQPILAGFLALDATYRSSLGGVLAETLKAEQGEGRLDLGCVAMLGTFGCGGADSTAVQLSDFAATVFLLELLARLQGCGTAPAMDFRAYAQWLERCEVRETKMPSAKRPGRQVRA